MFLSASPASDDAAAIASDMRVVYLLEKRPPTNADRMKHGTMKSNMPASLASRVNAITNAVMKKLIVAMKIPAFSDVSA